VFNELIPELQPFARALVDAAGAAGLAPRVTSTLRTFAQQKRLYDRYLAGLSPLPAAPPGHSAHEYGWAFDMVSTDNAACGDYWQQLGGVWGAARDPVHFEYPGFRSALGPEIAAAEALDEAPGSPYASTKDFLTSFVPVYGELTAGAELAKMLGFPQSEWIDLLAHPSKAVARYPWLRALGPPFMFY